MDNNHNRYEEIVLHSWMDFKLIKLNFNSMQGAERVRWCGPSDGDRCWCSVSRRQYTEQQSFLHLSILCLDLSYVLCPCIFVVVPCLFICMLSFLQSFLITKIFLVITLYNLKNTYNWNTNVFYW